MKPGDWLPALLTNFRTRPDRATSLRRYARLAACYDSATTAISDVRRCAIDQLALQPGETVFDVACTGCGQGTARVAGRTQALTGA